MSEAATAGSPREVSQWVTFALDGETYGIDVMRVQEVLRVSEIAPVPGAPHYVLGIVNLRGSVVTVADARQRFGLTRAEPDEAARIVIVEAKGQVMGLLVDRVSEVVEIAESEVESAPGVGGGDAAQFIQGVCGREDHLIILVDLDRLVETDEIGSF